MTTTPATGTLYVVSTPIGNLGDFTVRAVETLGRVRLILCEDTRHSRPLLDHYGIRTPLAALHEHNEARESARLVERLTAGDDMALISDAGTPLLSDPGVRLVRAALDAGVPVVPVPGASALLAALVASGLPGDAFTYLGFLPRKGPERRERLALLSALPHTGVLYESPHRLGATLGELELLLGTEARTRQAVVAREVTKRFEEFRRASVADLAAHFAEHEPRGEVVILVAGREEAEIDEGALRESARALRAEGATTRAIVHALTAQYGVPRNQAYRIAQGA